MWSNIFKHARSRSGQVAPVSCYTRGWTWRTMSVSCLRSWAVITRWRWTMTQHPGCGHVEPCWLNVGLDLVIHTNYIPLTCIPFSTGGSEEKLPSLGIFHQPNFLGSDIEESSYVDISWTCRFLITSCLNNTLDYQWLPVWSESVLGCSVWVHLHGNTTAFQICAIGSKWHHLGLDC